MMTISSSNSSRNGMTRWQRVLLCIFYLQVTMIAAFPNTMRIPASIGRTTTTSSSSSSLHSSRGRPEDLFAAVHRKEYEMKQVKSQHTSTTDPVNMAMGYGQQSASPMRLAKALRRVYDDPSSPANPTAEPKSPEQEERDQKLLDVGMADMGMRRASFIVDIKRKSLSGQPGEVFCNFDDAGMVAAAMVQLGADVVFVNTDYPAYGGDLAELKSAVRAVRRVSKTVPVVMKDIVVDEIQLGLAKEAGADGVVLMASVLGPALDNFLDLATTMGLETIVECHTRNEVQRALDALACTILVTNYDRVSQTYYPKQAIQLAGMFPGSGGPIICLAGGGIENTDQMKKHLAVGYDGVVVGKAVMGNPSAPEFIRAVRDRTLLPAEFSQWGLDDVEFDTEGNPMPGPKQDIPMETDKDVYQ
ncbi:Indole-3-glycerol phosphate synthase [Seminavis robusta]|uniref:indole-3-glycerol-phosphate synthase n=1 Tax=Seminavis robusta TaxID=568900 RepID=A0A9N8DZ91_9STRA|nr:Indole-3-glycerol phosphate synthase [Seminavis robusta]|eukprot:Sro386_g131840.1 Indole-3-glycerol phosphate synthase (416) ;mRNA; f:13256-14503